MNLIDSILRASSTVSKSKGKEAFLNKQVTKIEERKIGDNYHLYGRVIEGKDEYSTHINYDIKNKVIKSVNCSCDLYGEHRNYIKNYTCLHIIATAYKYYSIILKKEKRKIKSIKNKDLVDVDIIEKNFENEELKEEIFNFKNLNKETLISKENKTLKSLLNDNSRLIST